MKMYKIITILILKNNKYNILKDFKCLIKQLFLGIRIVIILIKVPDKIFCQVF